MTRETMAAILAVVVVTSCGGTVDATSAETTSQTAGGYEQVTSGDVHLWAHATPGDGSGEGAIVAGVAFEVPVACLSATGEIAHFNLSRVACRSTSSEFGSVRYLEVRRWASVR